jgi:iron complex outermembrane receptor protein
MRRTIVAAACSVVASVAFAQDQDAVVVTAKRFPERRVDAPIGMTVITAQDIERDTARTLPEVLSRLGGLHARNNSGSPDLQIDLRGFGITGDQNTLVLLDGVRVNENDLSSTKLSAIPLNSIERIEILRGSGGVLYGDNATGGTINIITRGPAPGRGGSVSLGAGSYGTYDLKASTNVSGERAGAVVSAGHLESDNYRVNNRLRQDNMAGDLRLGGDGTDVGLKFGADTQRLQLPGVRDENQLESDRRGATTPGDWSAREGAFATLQLKHAFGAAELALDLGHREQVSDAFFADFAPTAYSEIRTRSNALSPRLRWPFRALGVPSVLVAGVDWTDWDYDRRFAGALDGFGSPGSSTSGSQDSTGAYAQYSAQLLERTQLTLGGRAQRVSDHRVATGFGSSDQRQTQSPHASEIALSQGVSEALRVHVKAGRSFRVANVDENGSTLTNDLLKVQTARNKEVGLEYRGTGFGAGANAYRIDLDNEIYFSPLAIPVGGTFPGANVNLSPTRRRGVEVFANGHWPFVDVSANVIRQEAKFVTGTYGGVDVSGNDVPLVPRVLANLSATWHAASTRLTSALSYVGRQRYDNDQDNAFPRLMPAYALVDLKLAHDVGAWTWSAMINNLLDKKYYSYGIVNSFSCTTPVCAYPQAGRTFFVAARYAPK